jgi:hypothetical protein
MAPLQPYPVGLARFFGLPARIAFFSYLTTYSLSFSASTYILTMPKALCKHENASATFPAY